MLPVCQARHANQLHASDNPLRLVDMHLGIRHTAGELPRGLVGKGRRSRKQSATQKLKALQWYSRSVLKNIHAMRCKQKAFGAQVVLDAASHQIEIAGSEDATRDCHDS